MCGICGIVGFANMTILERMTAVIGHRGPDDEGHYISPDGKVSLGHRRLSILDLSQRGHQPMSNENGILWITFNGEIYNFREVQRELIMKGHLFKSESDTEVVLKAYEQWGKRCLDKFNGMFAFAIYNSITGDLFAARDRIGIKPFYYFHGNASLIFASEIKAILASGLVSAEPDYEVLYTPTRFQISPYTGFKNIFKLPPGHSLYFKDGRLSIEKYWKLAPAEKEMPAVTAVERLDELLQRTIELQMVADVEVGAFLSGGLDSSLITALMTQRTTKQVKTFTIKFRQQDQKFEQMSDDSQYAARVAAHFNLQHQEIEIEPNIIELLPKMVWHMDEPLADPAAINTYLICRAARELGIIVLLNGMGADEVFGGYRKQLACLKAETYQQLVPTFFQRKLTEFFDKMPVASDTQGLRLLRWSKRFLSFASLPQVERFLCSDLSLTPTEYSMLFEEKGSYQDSFYYQSQLQSLQYDGLSYLTRMCLNDTLVFLPEHNLSYCDKASMAVGVETRPPYTDHHLLEFAFTLKPELRIKGNQQKYLLRKVAEKYLPGEIVHRPKAPFGSPLRAWIRGPLKEMVDEYLSVEVIKKRALYNPIYVSDKIKLDREGREDNALLIWTLLTTEIWFRTFFDSGPIR
jgi:asparagine synthase (glutamine-hydrolysing)